ncbi:hypothetical protein HB364_32645 [Pseudoflavitalea sp. X16]|uniref:hypothetical protein n=1 Tax=Paraflavitalea devenefica TaxID=2716334 RepID=UPI001421E463|nr:hypothetical protein [Paraflavitalea devenefica]NII29873.1 hypothetical protein [Paraflavitalea devenefica]
MNRYLITLLLMLSIRATAQDYNAPYSIYGVGDLEQRFYDRSIGMANSSVSLMSTPHYQFLKNPASLAGLERSNVYVNMALTGKIITYAGTPIGDNNRTSRDMSIKSFSVATKLNNVWASSLGFMPLSYAGYHYTATKNVEGSNDTYSGDYTGDGGLYNIYWNNAFALGKHFSVGVRSSFIFGSINLTETLAGESLSSAIVTETKDYYNNVRFELGSIYTGKLAKNWKLSLGGKFTTKTNLNSEKTVTITEGTTVIKEDEVVKSSTFNIPVAYDAGLSVTHKDRLTIAVDYNYQPWSDLKQKGTGYSLINSHRFSAGVQFSNQVERWGQRYEKNYVQAGFFTNNSYLSIRNTQINEIGGSIGYGGFLTGNLFYGLSVEAGRRGTIANNLIKENYVQATLTLSLREFLFSKGRKYD